MSIKCLSDIGNAYNIGKHAGSRYFGTGTVPFDNHRVFFVTLGGDENYVIAAFEGIKRVSFLDFLQAGRNVAVV